MPPRSSGIKKRSALDIVVQKPKKPASDTKPNRLTVNGIRSTVYNPVSVPLNEIRLPQLLGPYMNSLNWKSRPQFTQLWQSDAVLDMTDCRFGSVPKGSVLSYQLTSCDSDAGDSTSTSVVSSTSSFALPELSDFVTSRLADLSSDFLSKFNSLVINQEQAAELLMTRDQTNSEDWHKLRKNRLTASIFKKICFSSW